MGSNTSNLYNLKNGANKLAEINITKDIVSGMVDSLSLISDDLYTVADNIVDVNTVATDIVNVNTVAESIAEVELTATNIGAVVALEANYDEIKTVSEQANFGLFNAINLSANVIGVDATIATGQNGVSFGDMTIAEGVTVTIEEGSSWAIL